MIATRSHTSSTSDSRCELSSTATPCAAQLLQQAPHGPAPGGIERAGRLVEQQQPRGRRPSPARSRAAAACPSTSSPTRVSPPRGSPTAASSRPRSRGAAVRPGQLLVHAEQLVGAQPVGEPEQLGEVAERAGAPPANRRARPRSAPCPRSRHQTAGDLHERGLAGAVGAQQPDELALADLEADALERLGSSRTSCADRRPSEPVPWPSIVPDGARPTPHRPSLGRHDAARARPDPAARARRSCWT